MKNIVTRLNHVRDALLNSQVAFKRNDVWYVAMPVKQREELAEILLQIIIGTDQND